MKKTRLTPGYEESGIKILKTLTQTSTYATTIFRVRFSCNHEADIIGKALNFRLGSIKRRNATNLCAPCSQNQKILDEWRKSVGRPERKKRKSPSSPGEILKAFSLFPSPSRVFIRKTQ